MLTPASYSQELGKLFTSKEQRDYLDYLREEYIASSTESGFDINEQQIPEIPIIEIIEPEIENGPDIVEYQFGGIMKKSDNSKIIWLNQEQYSENSLPAGFSLKYRNNEYLLQYSNDGNSYLVKPGQILNIVSGRVMEAYQKRNSSNTSPSAAIQIQGRRPSKGENLPNSDSIKETIANNSEISNSNSGDIEELPESVANLLNSLQLQ